MYIRKKYTNHRTKPALCTALSGGRRLVLPPSSLAHLARMFAYVQNARGPSVLVHVAEDLLHRRVADRPVKVDQLDPRRGHVAQKG